MATEWQRLFAVLLPFFGVEEVAEVAGSSFDVLLGEMCIDVMHGRKVVPTTNFCRNHLREL